MSVVSSAVTQKVSLFYEKQKSHPPELNDYMYLINHWRKLPDPAASCYSKR